MFNITLQDGTMIKDIEESGDAFFTAQELSKDLFKNNLQNVKMSGDRNETYSRMELATLYTEERDGKTYYFFVLAPISDEGLRNEYGISYLASLLLNDKQSAKAVFLFDDWDPNGMSYSVGDKVQYNDLLYKCLQAHTSQASWDPVSAVSLWVRIDNPAEEWPEWRQPLGAHDAYSKGYKVSHNGKHWTSDVDNNTWEPGVYGWTEVVEE